jgi:hypothetical protein
MPNENRPQSSVQAAGQVAEDVVAGLQQQPWLLGIVILNVIGISAALWFLHEIMAQSHENMRDLMRACVPHYQQQKQE